MPKFKKESTEAVEQVITKTEMKRLRVAFARKYNRKNHYNMSEIATSAFSTCLQKRMSDTKPSELTKAVCKDAAEYLRGIADVIEKNGKNSFTKRRTRYDHLRFRVAKVQHLFMMKPGDEKIAEAVRKKLVEKVRETVSWVNY